MLLLLTTLLRVKVNMKARGVSQIFALWLILMYIHVYLNFQVYPELVPTGHKWTSSKISKSNIGTGASFFTTISQPLNGVQAFLFFPLFFIFITNIKPQCWGRRDILSKHPYGSVPFHNLSPGLASKSYHSHFTDWGNRHRNEVICQRSNDLSPSRFGCRLSIIMQINENICFPLRGIEVWKINEIRICFP